MVHPTYPSLSLNCRRFLTGSQLTYARRLSLIVTIAMLSSFAVLPQAHAEISVPAAISDVYSDVNMRVQLATTKDVSAPCAGEECAQNKEFDQQVQDIGARLSKVAFEAYPDLSKRISRFEFVVAEKRESGTISNATGTVVIFRGVQELYLEEQALTFVIAREMGRVIGRHHDKNTGTSILLSVLVGVLFPATNIFHAFNGSAALANATSSTTVVTTAATTAASSATSFVSSKMVLAGIKPKQLREADAIAMRLLEPLEWSGRDIASSLEACTQIDGEDAWAKDFRFSAAHVRTLVPKEEVAMASAEPRVELPDFQKAQNAKSGKLAANTLKENAHLEDATIVAKNEVGVSSDAVVVGALTAPQASVSEAELPEAKLEEREATIEDETNDALTEESQLTDTVSLPAAKRAAKPSPHGAVAKKIAARGLNKKSSRVVSRKVSKPASKVASRNTKLKLAKAVISGKQMSTKKLYASKSSRVRLGMTTISKATKARAGLGSIKSVSANSKKVNANQIQASLR
ncbi:MAG TPA: hypothetical protein VJB68_08120 [Methylophilaceae bacterium]|nr:hypothetical protein [Methylophilaceae bacterium]